VQQYRLATSYALEMGVGSLAGGMMGLAASQVPELYMGVLKPPYTLISPAPIETLLPSIGLYIALAAGLAGSPAGVKTFGEERDVYYREASSGHNKLAYYIAKTVSMFYRFTSGAFHFAAVFHVFASPSMPFTIFFVIVICQYYAVYGLAAITSMVVKRENSALLGVIASLVAGCLCGFGPSLAQRRGYHLDWIQHISYARWASEAWFHYETLPYRDLYMVAEVSAPLFGYTLDRFGLDIAMMLVIGTAYRAVAFVLLVGLNRDKQR
jgi:succinate dehydrogenase hydrophobic anchor subunit